MFSLSQWERFLRLSSHLLTRQSRHQLFENASSYQAQPQIEAFWNLTNSTSLQVNDA